MTASLNFKAFWWPDIAAPEDGRIPVRLGNTSRTLCRRPASRPGSQRVARSEICGISNMFLHADPLRPGTGRAPSAVSGVPVRKRPEKYGLRRGGLRLISPFAWAPCVRMPVKAEKKPLIRYLTFNPPLPRNVWSVRQWSLRRALSPRPSLPQFVTWNSYAHDGRSHEAKLDALCCRRNCQGNRH